MGNRRRIRFWEDLWWGEEAFSTRFANLYRLSLASNSTIADLIVRQPGTQFPGWNLSFYRNLHASEIEYFVHFSAILD